MPAKKKDKILTIKDIFPNATERIVEAFTLNDGTVYYKFDDFNNIPCDRGFHALSFYNEMDMRCDKAFLLAALTGITNELNKDGKLDKVKVGNIVTSLKERVEYILEPECLYNLASVVYFDATENPYRFDYKYGKEKVKKFKAEEMDAFFLRQPIASLIPSINLSGGDLSLYLQVMEKANRQQLKNIFTTLLPGDKSSEWYSILKSREQEVYNLPKSATLASTTSI